ncbi:MAG: molybdopterin-dependent oxidoreductase [Myxococcota bacterium]
MPDPVQTHHTFCRICESLCGLEVDVRDGEVVEVRPDRQHVATRGFACVKGVRQQQMYTSPDRLTQPMKRVGDRFEPATWDEALADIGARVQALRRERGPNSIGMYVGTAAGFSILHPIFAKGFMDGLGSKSLFASSTQDCANKFAVATEVYGFPFTQPFPDLEHTELLIVVGANPVVSKWSFLQVPNPIEHLKAIQKRGGRVVVVDPRRTETAHVTGEHVFIRPGTDVFFYAAFLREVLQSGRIDRERCEAHTTGLDELGPLVEPWTPERQAEVTGIPAETLGQLVHDFLSADGASLYSSTGVNMGGNGALAFWLQEVIHAVSGNLDKRGGTLVGKGPVDFPRVAVKYGLLDSSGTSRISGHQAVNDALPGGVLADEILTPGDGQVRAMFVTGGNPLLTMANGDRLREAFEDLELLVCVDLFLNETASLAHWVLPAVSPLQRPDLPFVFPLFFGLQARPYLQATDAVLPPDGEQRDEATMYHDLARACGVGMFGSRTVSWALEALRWWTGSEGLPNRALLQGLLWAGGQGRLDALLAEPHGRALPDHAPGSYLGQRVLTGDGRVQLAPPKLVALMGGLAAAFEQERSATGLRLITRRHLTTHNSWTHNLDAFLKPHREQTNRLYIHPDDAAARGLSEDDLVDVTSATGAVRLPIALLDDLMPGVVALPHGWGHQAAKGLSIASRTRGVNVNLLAASGPAAIEPVSGMSRLTGIPVEVTRAAGPVAPTWSGIEAAQAP